MSKSLAELVSNLNASMLALRGGLQRVEDRAGSIAQLTETQQQSTEMIATANDRNSYDRDGIFS